MGRKEDIRVAAAVVLELSALISLVVALFLWWEIRSQWHHLLFLGFLVAGIVAAFFEYAQWRRQKREPYTIAGTFLSVIMIVVALLADPHLVRATLATILAAVVPAAAFALRMRAAALEQQAVKKLLDRDCLISDEALKAIAAADMRLEIRRAAEQVGKGFERPVSGQQIAKAMSDYLGYDVPEAELVQVLRYSLR